jgi:isoleucyl-tRNA synthetase
MPGVNPALLQPELAEKWKSLIAVKGEVAKALETARQNKTVGHSLDAAVAVAAPETLRPLLETHVEDLRALLIISDLAVVDADRIGEPYRSTEIPGLLVGVSRAQGAKCNRCWNYSATVGQSTEHPTLCSRCLQNL